MKSSVEAIATDFDGTLATSHRVTLETLAAVARWKAAGKKLVLVTGREMTDLKQVFPQYAVCDLVVAENGAQLVWPADGREELLGAPASPRLAEALRRHGVFPLSVGRSVIALTEKDLAVAVRLIEQLELDLDVILNKGSVMLLPAGIDKGTGVRKAAQELGLPLSNFAGIGDAENDVQLLSTCGMGVAVDNALPSLKSHAAWVTPRAEGAGVEDLIDRLLGGT